MVALSFQAWKAPLVESGQCRQTIRANRKRNPKVGDRLQLYRGQRTKQCRKLVAVDPIATEVIDVTMMYGSNGAFTVALGAQKLGKRQLNSFARNDGFMGKSPALQFEEFFAPCVLDAKNEFFEALLIKWRLVEPYRPSNSDEGYVFMNRWCDRCTREAGNRECSVLTHSLVGQPSEWIYNDEGAPICTSFRERGEVALRRNAGGKFRRLEAQGQLNLLSPSP